MMHALRSLKCLFGSHNGYLEDGQYYCYHCGYHDKEGSAREKQRQTEELERRSQLAMYRILHRENSDTYVHRQSFILHGIERANVERLEEVVELLDKLESTESV